MLYVIFPLFHDLLQFYVIFVYSGEIFNEAQNDRKYNINYTQKPSKSGCTSKNDAVVYQEEVSAILYEQSFGPTEFTVLHHLNDIVKLSHNGVDDLNFYFTQNSNCDVTTFKSIGIHGYSKYFFYIYIMMVLINLTNSF